MMAASSRRAILCGMAALPVMSGVAIAAPSDLACACDWAVHRTTWINEAAHDSKWTDELLKAEIDRLEAVFVRAIEEPSRSPSDLGAKARLLLQDLKEGGLEDGNDNDQRLLFVVLQEVIALCA